MGEAEVNYLLYCKFHRQDCELIVISELVHTKDKNVNIFLDFILDRFPTTRWISKSLSGFY